MAKKQNNQSSSHDRLFKEFLHRFLPRFLEIFFPNEAARLDFRTLTFPNQELIVNLPKQALRITDVVAEVNTLEGQPEVIIVHVDVEANKPKQLPRRMFDYYALLRMLRQKPVLPIALVLKSGVGGLKWRTYSEKLFGRSLLRFQYGQIGIRDLPSQDYLQLHDPVAAALATLMKPGEQSNAKLKLDALRTVIDSGLTDGDKLFLINIVETYLPRVEVFDAREEVMQTLTEVETNWVMRAMNEGLQQGVQQGMQQGVQQGMHTLLFLQLTVKFGELPQHIVKRLNTITDQATLMEISRQLLTAQTLGEISALQPRPETENALHI